MDKKISHNGLKRMKRGKFGQQQQQQKQKLKNLKIVQKSENSHALKWDEINLYSCYHFIVLISQNIKFILYLSISVKSVLKLGLKNFPKD